MGRRRGIRLAVALAAISLLVDAAAAAPASRSGTVLFVTSAPLRATVYIDGNALPGETPVLVRDVAPGRHTVRVHKDGYGAVQSEVTVEAGKPATVSVELEPARIALALAGPGELLAGGRRVPGGAAVELPPGGYAVSRSGAAVTLRPVYPASGWITAMDVLIPVVAALASLSALEDVSYGQGSALYFSPLTITCFAVTVGAIGLDAAFRIDRGRWLRSFAVVDARPASAEAEDAVIARAERELAEGRLDEAVAALLRHAESFPESPRAPGSLYQIAKIEQLQGEGAPAAATLRLLLSRYPTPDLYDKATKSLAEVLAAQGDWSGAIRAIDGMVLLDSLYTPEEIGASRAELLQGWAADEPSRWSDAAAAYAGLVDAWPESPRLPEYRYLRARALWESGERERALAALAAAREGAGESLLESIEELQAEIGGAQ